MTIGFDLGTYNCVASVTRKGVTKSANMLDITLDEASKRSVAPMISYPEKDRLFGNMSKSQFKRNAQVTTRQPQRLLGVSMENMPQITSSTRIVPNPITTTGGVTTPVFEVNYRGQNTLIHPIQAMASILKHQTKHALERTQGTECCITIPNNCSYAKREALLAAAEVAGVQTMKLISSTSALSHDLGLLGGKNAVENDCATLFLDIGHSGSNIGVVKFINGGWDIVAQDTFEEFCGQVIENKLMNHFAQQFRDQNGGEDFLKNAGATHRVKGLIPKLLKLLVVDLTARASVDYLYAGCDFDASISREYLWEMISQEANAFGEYLTNFLEVAKEKLKDVQFDAVEIVGGVSRMVDLKAMLSDLCNQSIGISTLSTHLNTDEAAARGCVLQCAILSPRFGIRAGKVRDTVPYAILVGRQAYDPAGPSYDPMNWTTCNLETLFPTYNELNKTKTIKFKKPRPLVLYLVEQTTRGEQRLIGWASIDTSGETLADGEDWSKFQILVSLDHSGLIALRTEVTKTYVQMVDVKKTKEVELTEEEYAEAFEKAKAEAQAKVEAEAAKKAEAARKKAEEAAEKADDVDMADQAEEDIGNADDVEMEDTEIQIPPVVVPKTKTVEYVEQQEKKMHKKSDVPVTYTSYMGIDRQQLEDMKAQEAAMDAWDKECVAIQTARNNLESYVLEAQTEFADGGLFYEFMSEEEAENFMNLVFEMEEWVGDNEDETLVVYNEKLDSMQKIGNVYEVRQKEWEKRAKTLVLMKKTLTKAEMWIAECQNQPEEFEYIASELAELSAKLTEATAWLDERQQLSHNCQKTDEPPYFAFEIMDKAKEINVAFHAVQNIKKPEPKQTEEELQSKDDEDGKGEDNADTKDNVEMEDTEAAGNAAGEKAEA